MDLFIKVNLLQVALATLMLRSAVVAMAKNVKCRNSVYPRSQIERFPVPDDKVSWSSKFPEYEPVQYTSPYIHGKPWSDPEIGMFHPKFHYLDHNVDRSSYTGKYKVEKGYPLNPEGRTGITGRGLLGRWGPNHAADPVVTRWKVKDGQHVYDINKKPVLQFIAIKRSDSGEWAIPGGMVDPGERVSAAALREFQEEAINSMNMTEDEKQSWMLQYEKFFNAGDEIFRGYVDDPRNTDNAWMETIAYNFHDEKGDIVGDMKLHAGDDAVGVTWVDITPNMKLYASHEDIIKKVHKKLVS